MPQDYVEPLVNLGFTPLEAEVYARLVEESAVTGYRVAQLLGRPAANVYKAIESLQAKGAVVVDEGDTRVCRAVPSDELLALLERRFRRDRDRARRALARVARPRSDDRVYRLRSVDQVWARCREMIGGAKDVIVVDAFPETLAVLVPDLERAAAAGRKVGVLAYGPVRIEGARVVLNPTAARVRSRWPGQWLNLSVDGSQHLVSFLDPDGSVRQAVWTRSPYLSWVYHSAVSSELILAAVQAEVETGDDGTAARRLLDELLPLRATEGSGYRELLREVTSGETESTEVLEF